MNWTGIYEIESEDGLSMERWRFWLCEGSIFELDGVSKFSRLSRQHKFRSSECWDRLYQRDSTMPKPEVPQHIKDFIKQKFIEEIKFI